MGNDVYGNQGKVMTEVPNPTPDKPKKKIIADPRSSSGDPRSSSSGDRPQSQERRGKGKRGREEDRKPAIPPALIRGPRPQPKAEPEETVTEIEATTETPQDVADVTDQEVSSDPSEEAEQGD